MAMVLTDDVFGRLGWVSSVAVSVGTVVSRYVEYPLIEESDNMLLANVNYTVLYIALLLAVFTGVILLYYGKYTKSNAQKAKALASAKVSGKETSVEIEEFDRIFIPSAIATGALTMVLGYIVLTDVLATLEIGYTIPSSAFAGFLAYLIALVFFVVVDYPIHETANAIRNGGIAKAQLVLKDILSDGEKRERVFQAVVGFATSCGKNIDQEALKEKLEEYSGRKLLNTDWEAFAKAFVNEQNVFVDFGKK